MKYKKKRLKDLKERRLKRKKNEQGRYISSDHLTMNVLSIYIIYIIGFNERISIEIS